MQGNCPPACTQIPDSAWIAPAAIPLYGDYSWAPLAPLSEPVSNPRFEADELCAAGPAHDDERDSTLAVRIMLPNPPGRWQLQVQILQWRGDPWIAGQRASAVMDSATSMLRNKCSFTAPGVSVSRIAEQNLPGGHPGQSLTAVITEAGATPRVTHEYLVSDLHNSTVVEVVMWSTSPPALTGQRSMMTSYLQTWWLRCARPTSTPAPLRQIGTHCRSSRPHCCAAAPRD
jgi:hypothetical protein